MEKTAKGSDLFGSGCMEGWFMGGAGVEESGTGWELAKAANGS